MARKYNSVILLKSGYDIVTDGGTSHIVEGGNAGLTKGGTGDVLAGLCASFYCKNKPMASAMLASFFLKKTSENLFQSKGYWYNISNIIERLPEQIKKLVIDNDESLN